MALSATIYNFDVELADNDRGVYESLALRLARHPSESEEYLVARLLAYLLEFTEGIAFSRGVSSPDEPAIAVRDLTGAIGAWIDIGAPDAARLHRASKAAGRVAVYTHKDPTQFLKGLAGEKIHRAAALELYAIDRGSDRRACHAPRASRRVQPVDRRSGAVRVDRHGHADREGGAPRDGLTSLIGTAHCLTPATAGIVIAGGLNTRRPIVRKDAPAIEAKDVRRCRNASW